MGVLNLDILKIFKDVWSIIVKYLSIPLKFIINLPWYFKIIVYLPIIILSILIIIWTWKNREEFRRRG